MKFLLWLLIAALSCQVILCEEDANLIRMVNTVASQLIQNGVEKGDLPGGPYYVHNVVKSLIGIQYSQLTIDVRRLDNQTNVTIRATVDNNDFSVKSSCLASKIGKNIIALSQGWAFAWQNYAPNGRDDEFCTSDIQKEIYFDNPFELTAENLALDSAIKSTYQQILDGETSSWKYIMDDLDPNFPPGPVYLISSGDFIFVYQYVGQEAGTYDYYIYSLYQPCTGDRRAFPQATTLSY